MTYDETLDALEYEIARAVRLAEATPPDLDIPTCPGWKARDLWQHLGTVHRWAAEIVRTRSDAPLDRSFVEDDLPTGDTWAPWLAEGGDTLLEALRGCPSEQPVWTWGPGGDAAWWARRQLHETIVHDADAAMALGEDPGIGPRLAAACIDERLDNLAASLFWRGEDGQVARPMTVHLHATDEGVGEAGEWMISLAPSVEEGSRSGGAPRTEVSWQHAHGKGDVAVRGPVATLLLALYGRLPGDHSELACFGEPTVWEEFRDTVRLG